MAHEKLGSGKTVIDNPFFFTMSFAQSQLNNINFNTIG